MAKSTCFEMISIDPGAPGGDCHAEILGARCPSCGKLSVRDFLDLQPGCVGLMWFQWRCFSCGWRSERQNHHPPSRDQILQAEWETLNSDSAS